MRRCVIGILAGGSKGRGPRGGGGTPGRLFVVGPDGELVAARGVARRDADEVGSSREGFAVIIRVGRSAGLPAALVVGQRDAGPDQAAGRRAQRERATVDTAAAAAVGQT